MIFDSWYTCDFNDCNLDGVEIDTMAEWLRRGPAKLVLFECASSNLVGVEVFVFMLFLHSHELQDHF